MSLHDMLQWWNLIYILPLFVSVLWLAATVALGLHGGDTDLGHDADVAHDFDLDHDVEFGHDVELDQDVDADSGGDADNDAATQQPHHFHRDIDPQESSLYKLLSLLGVGKVPVTGLLGMFMLAWGSFGMLSNRIFGGVLHYPAIYIWPSMAATFFVSAVLTRTMAGLFARFMPTSETYGVSRMQLIGNMGKAVFKITETMGTVDIKDQYGTIHREQAKVDSGCPEIAAGSDVIVIEYDDSDKRFIVKRSAL